MKIRLWSLIALVVQLNVACSGKNSVDRSDVNESQTSASGETGQTNPNAKSNTSGDAVGFAPQPITGTNLVEIIITTKCVGIQGETKPSCKEVRLGAKVKVNDQESFRFAVDTKAGLGVKSFGWSIKPPAGATCQSTGDGFEFNPKCSSSNSLENAAFMASLTLLGDDGKTHVGEILESYPVVNGGVFGNFMQIEPSASMASSGIKYDLAIFPFNQIWQDLVGGLYLTNVLNDGSDGTGTFAGSESLCKSVNSGDGAGKWRAPSIIEMCGSNYESANAPGTCNGGLYRHGIGQANYLLGHTNSGHYYWSSTLVAGDELRVWIAYLSLGSTAKATKNSGSVSTICVRAR